MIVIYSNIIKTIIKIYILNNSNFNNIDIFIIIIIEYLIYI